MRTVAGADMAITGQELRSARFTIWRNLSGPLLVLIAVAFIEILKLKGFRIPNPPAILLLVVAFSAFYGGMVSGMASATMATRSPRPDTTAAGIPPTRFPSAP